MSLVEQETLTAQIPADHERFLNTWAVLKYFVNVSEINLVSGPNQLNGPLIIAAHHCGWTDAPAILEVIYKRYNLWTRWMAADNLFKLPLLGKLMIQGEMIPVDRRGNNIATIRNGKKILQQNGLLGIMVSGTRGFGNEIAEIKEAKLGTAYMAIKSGVSVVPVGIVGPEHYLPDVDRVVKNNPVRAIKYLLELRRSINPPINIAIGEPIDVQTYITSSGRRTNRENVGKLTNQIQDKITRLVYGLRSQNT